MMPTTTDFQIASEFPIDHSYKFDESKEQVQLSRRQCSILQQMSSKKMSQTSCAIVPEFLEMMPQQPMSAYLNFIFETYGNYWEFLNKVERSEAHSKWMRMEPRAKAIRLKIAKQFKKKYLAEIAEWRQHFQISNDDFRGYQKHCTKLKQKLPLIARKDASKDIPQEPLQESAHSEDESVKSGSQQMIQAAVKNENCPIDLPETNFAELNQDNSSRSEDAPKYLNRLRSRSNKKLRKRNFSRMKEDYEDEEEEEKEPAHRASNNSWLVEDTEKNNRSKDSKKQNPKSTRKGRPRKVVEEVQIQDVKHLKSLIQVCFGKSDKISLNISGRITISLGRPD